MSTLVAADGRGAIRYDDVRAGRDIELTADEAENYAKRAEELSKLLDSKKKVVAKYKLEVLFGKARSITGLTPGALTFWASGSKLHGGGDDKLYLCPGRALKESDCQALLLDSYNGGGGIVCPSCGQFWKNDACIGELFFNLTMRGWAQVIHTHFRACESDCDIYLKHALDDVRSISLAQATKQTWKGSQALAKSREQRARHIYPLRNILKDTSAGADLMGRFYAFLTA